MNSLITVMIAISLLASCTKLDTHQKYVEILSMKITVDKSMPDSQVCADFVMSKSELVNYFLVADEVSTSEYNGSAIILPCQYEGELLLKGDKFSYEVVAGGLVLFTTKWDGLLKIIFVWMICVAINFQAYVKN